jgi:hypothetical protein
MKVVSNHRMQIYIQQIEEVLLMVTFYNTKENYKN